jgi:hypothetical protein
MGRSNLLSEMFKPVARSNFVSLGLLDSQCWDCRAQFDLAPPGSKYVSPAALDQNSPAQTLPGRDISDSREADDGEALAERAGT